MKFTKRLLSVSAFIFYSALAHTQNPIDPKFIGLSKAADYTSLTQQGFQPRKDVAPWPISLPIEWDADPFNDRNWRFQLHAWRLIDPILAQYRDTGEQRYLQESMAIIKDWYHYHYELNNESKYQWYDMATGIRAMKLAWLWYEINQPSDTPQNDLANQDLLVLFNALMELHAEKLTDETLLSKGNHAYFQLVGLKLLCTANSDLSSCEKEYDYNSQHMQDLLSQQFTQEGVHRENAPGYHLFTIKTIQRLNIAQLYGDTVSDLLESANNVMPWLVYPDKTVARIGDTENKLNTHCPTAVTYTINNTEIIFADYIKSGYFSLRTPCSIESNQATQLFITGTSNIEKGYTGHKHADELSFELFHKGQLIFIDSGKYSYNSNDFRKYVRSASAHNTLSFADYPINHKQISETGSKLVSIEMNSEYIEVFGHVSRPELFDHDRTFYIKPFEEIIIKDSFVKTLPMKKRFFSMLKDTSITSNLHITPTINVTVTNDNTVQLDDLASVELISNKCKLKIINGQEDPILGWVSFKYNEIEKTNVLQAYCPAINNGELEWNIQLL